MDWLAPAAVAVVTLYFLVAWLLVGRDPAAGPIVTLYEPPAGLSPSLMRFIWKQGFDDRALWAGVLNLVAQKLATLTTRPEGAFVAITRTAARERASSKEEQFLLDGLSQRRKSDAKGVPFSLLDPEGAHIAVAFGNRLRMAAIGKLFNENRNYVLAGSALSLVAVFFIAQPPRPDDLFALIAGLVVMAPGAFGFYLLCFRFADLLRCLKGSGKLSTIRRLMLVGFMLLVCGMSAAFGCALVGFTFSRGVVAAIAFLVILNLVFLHLMKAPTTAGRRILDKIEGFRQFLSSVERLPLDRSDSPSDRAGIYERYLPYAVALEVEQGWSDKFVAIESTFHMPDADVPGAHSFYLGMFEGKPIDVAFDPRRGGRRY